MTDEESEAELSLSEEEKPKPKPKGRKRKQESEDEDDEEEVMPKVSIPLMRLTAVEEKAGCEEGTGVQGQARAQGQGARVQGEEGARVERQGARVQGQAGVARQSAPRACQRRGVGASWL